MAHPPIDIPGEVMFNTIMVPVDLRHEAHLGPSLEMVGHLAKAYDAKVIFVGVSLAAPTEIAHNPKEFKAKLAYFTRDQSRHYGFEAESHPVFSVDPAADLNRKLLDTIDELDADLVIMATHIPNVSDYLFANHGNYIATHCKTSVCLVRASE
ncbi:universal stress protein [Photobacterium sp. MCCC 1A19761]|uniref:universal stress protein n=1 Tax=Photobacterium sp. MCCC 1A19761 TaxID=3115000 RepID=UPI00307E6983